MNPKQQLQSGEAYFEQANYAKAMRIDQKMMQQAKAETDYPNWLHYANQIGRCYHKLREPNKAIAFLIYQWRHCFHYLSTDNLFISANTFNLIGFSYYQKGDFRNALHWHKKALRLQRNEEIRGVSAVDKNQSYNYIGNAYFCLARYDHALEQYKTGLVILRKAYGNTHPKICLMYGNVANVYMVKGDYKTAIALNEKSLRLQQQLDKVEDNLAAQTYYNLGNNYFQLGKYKKALRHYDRALQLRTNQLGVTHPQTITCLINKGICLKTLDKFGDAGKCFDVALDKRQRTLGARHPKTLNALGNKADLAYQKGDFQGAIRTYEYVLATEIEVLTETHNQTAETLNNLANCWSKMGKYEKALQLFERALRVNSTIFGHTHWTSALGNANIGEVYYQQGRYQDALAQRKKALELRLQLFGEYHTDVAISYMDIAECHDILSELGEALSCRKKALAILQHIWGEEHQEVGKSYNAVGLSLYRKGKPSEAISFHQKALPIFEEILGKQHQMVATTYNYLGNSHFANADYDEAETHYQKALTIQIAVVGEQHLDVARSYYNLGNCNVVKGNTAKAIELIQKCLSIRLKIWTAQHPGVAHTYFSLGNVYYNQGEYDVALGYYEQAESIQNKVFKGHHAQLADTYYNRSLCYVEKGNYSEALGYMENALTIRQDIFGADSTRIATCYSGLGLCYFYKGDYTNALKFYQKKLDIELNHYEVDHFYIADTQANIANCYLKAGQYAEALPLYQQALHIQRKQWQSVKGIHNDLAEAHDNLGKCYFEQGKLSEALDHHQQALNIRQQALNNPQHISIADNHNYLGNCFLQQKKQAKALHQYEIALGIYLKNFGEQHPQIARSHTKIGLVQGAMNNFEAAWTHHKKALKIQQQILGTFHPDVAKSHLHLALYFENQQDYLAALTHCQKALQSVVKGFTEDDLGQNPVLEGYDAVLTLLDALHQKARLWLNRFLHDYSTQTNASFLEKAYATYQLATTLLDKVRRSFKAEASKLVLAKKAADIYEGAILATLLLHQIEVTEATKYHDTGAALVSSTGQGDATVYTQYFQMEKEQLNVNHYLEEAFALSEKSKAMALLGLMKEDKAKQLANIPEPLLMREKALRKKLTQLETAIYEEKQKGPIANGLLIAEWQTAYFAANQDYIQLIDQFEQDYPEYYRLKYDLSATTIADLQGRILQKGIADVVISYFIGEQQLFVFVVESNGFKVVRYEKPKQFTQLVKQFKRAIQFVQRKSYASKAHELYELLIARLFVSASGKTLNSKDDHESYPKWCVIPDSILTSIPFEALLCSPASADSKYANFDYLLMHKEVSYHYSATLLVTSKNSEQDKSSLPDSFVGFAPVYAEEGGDNRGKRPARSISSSALLNKANVSYHTGNTRSVTIRGKGYKELIYSEEELKNISSLFTQKGYPTETYLHQKASKQNFRNAIKGKKYVLIAAHGVENDKQPEMSGILFSPEKMPPTQKSEQQIDNGLLHITDTYNLEMDAELVVLSSCKSGIGEFVKGEGMIAINRGFLYSGAANVIYTLFKVYDKPSSELTQNLFKYILTENADYATALRKAKIELIEKGSNDPKKWAGFVLIGT